jgi:hypothetical protein
MNDPEIRAALAPAVAGIVSPHDFRTRTMLEPHVDCTFGSGKTI